MKQLSIVIPTYNEKENIIILVDRIDKILKSEGISGEMIIVDDNSPDGTGEIAEKLKKKYALQVVHRKGKFGLSSAVLEGFKVARSNVLGVMDADLSHPPEKLAEMFDEIQKGYDLVIGSRYIPGGKIIGWNLNRKILSKGATFLSKVFTRVNDPMTGFFLVRRECLENRILNSRGFKILLELLMKGNCKRVKEVPITFTNRQLGKSKANFKEILLYIRNLTAYLPYKFKKR